MKFLIILTALIISVSCKENKFRLTEKENEIRLGSCGEPMAETLWLATLYKSDDYEKKLEELEKLKPRKTTPPTSTSEGPSTELTTEEPSSTSNDITGSSTELTTSTSETATTTEKYKQPPPTNAVFISQTHLLTSSSWFLLYNASSWRWKDNLDAVDDSICNTDKTASFRTQVTKFHVLDSRNYWRRAVEIIFLRYCEFKGSQEGFLTLIVVERNDMPVPVVCLPKVINKNEQPKVQRFEWKKMEEVGEMVKKCEVNNTAYFYTLAQACDTRRGAPLIKTDSFGIDRLIGVGAIASPLEQTMYRFHIIQEYMKEMCELMGVCGREVEKIELLPNPNSDDWRALERKKLETIDSDYVEQVAEPEFKGYNGKRKEYTSIGMVAVLLCMWFWE